MIFESFWRKCEATPGTGLGLAIAKELMEKQGGRLWVEETPGAARLSSSPLPVGKRTATR
jgi:signal transduction histidine kinase